MKTKNVYTRKISSEEASEGYILVLKNRLDFFPPSGKQFILVHGNREKKGKVESYPCTCQCPDLPHEHYFIRWNGLKVKENVEIEKYPRKEKKYILRIHP